MSEPVITNDVTGIVEVVRGELMGAASSLNMPPEPRDDVDEHAFYMTDKFRWAHHSHDHVLAAITNLNTMEQEMREIQHRLFRMAVKTDDEVVKTGLLALSERMSNAIRKPIDWDSLLEVDDE